jgi:hypothetical protein
MSDKDPPKKEEEKAPSGELALAGAQYKLFTDKADEIRKRSDRVANAIASAGAAAVTGLGIWSFADVFPYYSEAGLWWVVLLMGLLFAGAGILGTYTIWNRVQEPLVMVSELSDVTDSEGKPLDEGEQRTIGTIYTEIANLNGVTSLRAYEARGHRLRRIAENAPPEEAAELNGRADLIASEVGATAQRALHAVVRRRAWQAGAELPAWAAVFAVFLGLAASALAHDRITDARDQHDAKAQDQLLQECIDQRKQSDSDPPSDRLNFACLKLGLEDSSGADDASASAAGGGGTTAADASTAGG